MDLLSLSTSLLSAHSLPSHPSLGSLNIRNPLPRTPIISLRPLKCSLGSQQLSKNPQTLDIEFNKPRPSLHLSAPQAPARGGANTDAMGLLMRERIVFLGNEIDDFVADAIISQLLLLDAQDPTKDIRLFINSPGGSLSATMAIYDVVKLVRADVSTVALGMSASTASIILGGGTKGKRLAMPNTRIMIHQPLGSASGKSTDVEIQALELMKNKNTVIKIISDFTGRSFAEVKEDIFYDRYLSPIEALEYGIIDGVIDGDNTIRLSDTTTRLMSVVDRVPPNVEELIGKGYKRFMLPDIPDDQIF